MLGRNKIYEDKKVDEEEAKSLAKLNETRKYFRQNQFNKTMTSKYADESKKCPFAFTIQLVTSDFAPFTKFKERGRWKLKVSRNIFPNLNW